MTGIMREKEYTLTAAVPTPAVLVGDLDDIVVQLQGISGDSFDIEGSLAEGQRVAIAAGDWDKIGATQVADDTLKVASGPKWLRVNKLAGASAVIVRITGRVRIR
jgi:hypothetical protein